MSHIHTDHSSVSRYESLPSGDFDEPTVLDKSMLNISAQPLEEICTSENRPRSWGWHIFSHIVSFLWTVPTITLLILNFKTHILGPVVWCPKGRCNSAIWEDTDDIGDNSTAITHALEHDKVDHNALGVLQLFAKALEVWFILIATALVYDLSMMIARKNGGLPIGFILTHIEFANIRHLFNPLHWTSSTPLPGALEPQKRNALRLFLFSLFTALLAILANLMGPATAVLMLPTAQWIDMSPSYSKSYVSINSPNGDIALEGCTASMLSVGNFSCAYDVHGKAVDEKALITLPMGGEGGFVAMYDRSALLNVQESGLIYQADLTSSTGNAIAFAPNREVIRFLAGDLRAMDDTRSNWLKKSMSLVMNREGPSFGFRGGCTLGNISVTNVGDEKQILCLNGWDYSTRQLNDLGLTKCYRLGKGFNTVNSASSFFVQNHNEETKISSTAVDLFFSDKATYFNSTSDFGSGIKSCLEKDDPADCDWDRIFSHPLPRVLGDIEVPWLSANLTIVSYSLPPDPNPPDDEKRDRDARILCHHVSYLSFPTYSFEPSHSVNLVQVGRMLGLDQSIEDDNTLIVDPDWILAAWSVDRNGTIGRDRPISLGLTDTLPRVEKDFDDLAGMQFLAFHWSSMVHVSSMITWNYTDPELTTNSCSSFQILSDNRCLKAWVSRRVWAFGISSRTSKLGVAAVIIGIICVLGRLLLGVLHPIMEHRPLELFIAALHHQPGDEFDRSDLKTRSTRQMAKIRYRIVDDKDSKPSFIPE